MTRMPPPMQKPLRWIAFPCNWRSTGGPPFAYEQHQFLCIKLSSSEKLMRGGSRMVSPGFVYTLCWKKLGKCNYPSNLPSTRCRILVLSSSPRKGLPNSRRWRLVSCFWLDLASSRAATRKKSEQRSGLSCWAMEWSSAGGLVAS